MLLRMIAPNSNALDRMLTPLAGCLTPESAQRVLEFQLEAETRSRIDELARKSDEGRLDDAEQAEYLDYVDAIDLIGILQSKARQILTNTRGS
jgi:hypothetical protein